MFLELRERSEHQHNIKVSRYVFHADWSIRIRVGHIKGEKQPLRQQADEKLIMFSCLTLLTVRR